MYRRSMKQTGKEKKKKKCHLSFLRKDDLYGYILSPLLQGFHAIEARMRTALLNALRRRMALKFLSIVFALSFAYEPFKSHS